MAQHFAGLEAGDPECRLEGGAPDDGARSAGILAGIKYRRLPAGALQSAFRNLKSDVWLRQEGLR